jgi:primosomal protein N' (replication factor Y)
VLDRPPGPVGAVVLPDLDGLLRRPSLDAAEDALRLAFQVASWTVHAGDDPADSRVVVQTREPEHHAIAALAAWDPGGFWRHEVALRAPLRFPPITAAIRLSTATDAVLDGHGLAAQLAATLPPGDTLLGPLPEDGRDGYLVTSDDRVATLVALAPLRERCSREGVELRVDVDPVDAG